MSAVRLGLRENLSQFSLLVVVNAFVGAMIGMERRLSGGEQQRVAIARALANQPPIIFADEPTASLDTERGFAVIGLLRQIAKERSSAVIVVAHDERMIAGFDTVKRLRDGRFVEI
jgi:putative ABC transport system ATP-binding protein